MAARGCRGELGKFLEQSRFKWQRIECHGKQWNTSKSDKHLCLAQPVTNRHLSDLAFPGASLQTAGDVLLFERKRFVPTVGNHRGDILGNVNYAESEMGVKDQ